MNVRITPCGLWQRGIGRSAAFLLLPIARLLAYWLQKDALRPIPIRTTTNTRGLCRPSIGGGELLPAPKRRVKTPRIQAKSPAITRRLCAGYGWAMATTCRGVLACQAVTDQRLSASQPCFAASGQLEYGMDEAARTPSRCGSLRCVPQSVVWLGLAGSWFRMRLQHTAIQCSDFMGHFFIKTVYTVYTVNVTLCLPTNPSS